MKYKSFVIHNYRAISSDLEIKVDKKNLIPIIGVNESGKTSILWAIFSFDFFNDNHLDGKHLVNVTNLYDTSADQKAIVTANIELKSTQLIEILNELPESENRTSIQQKVEPLADEKIIVSISRNLQTKLYRFKLDDLEIDESFSDALSRKVIESLPYILYFDDFRDSVNENIEITGSSVEDASGWLATIEQLFKKTDSKYSVFTLASQEELRRESIIADVTSTLNETLTEEWKNFTLEESDEASPLAVRIQFKTDAGRNFLRLLVTEKVGGSDKFFGIQDRSKGFYWFFNFVMKLEFNPKIRAKTAEAKSIYLLDEPGSYLHSNAQTKLCKKLRQISEDNVVIYSTHTHYLLDPDTIPYNNIQIADKDKGGSISLVKIHDYKDESKKKRNALQPIIDALHIKPFSLDQNIQKICIVEGIYDKYFWELFFPKLKSNKLNDISFLPSVNAQSISYYISLSIFWGREFVAIWDNDKEGNKEQEKALEHYGENYSKKLLVYPQIGNATKTILQDFIDGNDLRRIKEELNIATNSSFEKTIASLYFSENKTEIVASVSEKTSEKVQLCHDVIVKGFNKN